MIEAITVAARFVQLTGAVLLFGIPLFALYGAKRVMDAFPRRLLLGATAGVVAGSLAHLLAQTASMSGAPSAAFDPAAVFTVLTGTRFGLALGLRLLLATVALVLLRFSGPPGRTTSLTIVGAGLLATFAWTGHGAMEDGVAGSVHALSDVIHLLAAGLWLGALAAFIALLTRDDGGRVADMHATHQALAGFAGVGSFAVVALLASGLLNSWFLVGVEGLPSLLSGPYGWLLVVKVLLFGVMLVLAATNRVRLTPALGARLAAGAPTLAEVRNLRRSLLLEMALGVCVLAAVSVMGILTPAIDQV